jgi:hypothetical protein
MENLFLLIGAISLLFYIGNILADFTYERPLSAHTGYGIICILTCYQINMVLFIVISFLFVIYSLLTFTVYLESIKSKRHV